jgi:hypothetical protein
MSRHVRMTPESSTRPALLRGAALLAVAGTLALGSMAGVASAKGEVGSGGGGTGVPVACNPVSSLTYKGDATTSDTALATVQVTYSVKSCTKDAVTVDTRVAETAVPANVVWEQADAPLSSKFTAAVKVNTSYLATVTVRDAATGDPISSSSIFVAARFKRV